MLIPCQDVTIFSAPFAEEAGTSHSLLYRAAQRYSGLSTAELGPMEVTPWGKPFFSQTPSLHFSITHSGDWWLCGFSGAPLGLDLQVHRSHMPPKTLSQRFFHPLEDAYLAQENYLRFFDLWCAKESWVKYTGHGFFDDPESFSVVSRDGSFPAKEGVALRLLPFSQGYSLCVCSAHLEEIHFSSLLS